MFSSLFRRKQQTPRRRLHRDRGDDPFSKPYSPIPSPGPASRPYLGERHATADFTEADDDDDDSVGEDDLGPYQDDPADEDGTQRAPILPLFSATYLGKFILFYSASYRHDRADTDFFFLFTLLTRALRLFSWAPLFPQILSLYTP